MLEKIAQVGERLTPLASWNQTVAAPTLRLTHTVTVQDVRRVGDLTNRLQICVRSIGGTLLWLDARWFAEFH